MVSLKEQNISLCHILIPKLERTHMNTGPVLSENLDGITEMKGVSVCH